MGNLIHMNLELPLRKTWLRGAMMRREAIALTNPFRTGIGTGTGMWKGNSTMMLVMTKTMRVTMERHEWISLVSVLAGLSPPETI